MHNYAFRLYIIANIPISAQVRITFLRRITSTVLTFSRRISSLKSHFHNKRRWFLLIAASRESEETSWCTGVRRPTLARCAAERHSLSEGRFERKREPEQKWGRASVRASPAQQDRKCDRCANLAFFNSIDFWKLEEVFSLRKIIGRWNLHVLAFAS